MTVNYAVPEGYHIDSSGIIHVTKQVRNRLCRCEWMWESDESISIMKITPVSHFASVHRLDDCYFLVTCNNQLMMMETKCNGSCVIGIECCGWLLEIDLDGVDIKIIDACVLTPDRVMIVDSNDNLHVGRWDGERITITQANILAGVMAITNPEPHSNTDTILALVKNHQLYRIEWINNELKLTEVEIDAGIWNVHNDTITLCNDKVMVIVTGVTEPTILTPPCDCCNAATYYTSSEEWNHMTMFISGDGSLWYTRYDLYDSGQKKEYCRIDTSIKLDQFINIVEDEQSDELILEDVDGLYYSFNPRDLSFNEIKLPAHRQHQLGSKTKAAGVNRQLKQQCNN